MSVASTSKLPQPTMFAFNSMQNGSQEHAGSKLLQTPRPWTELFFEYSALLVLRARST
jgi:hypothetical protein